MTSVVKKIRAQQTAMKRQLENPTPFTVNSVRAAGATKDSLSAAAVLMFHCEGDFATYFGLDVDNNLAIGGYSFDKVRHRIFHEGFTGNLSTQADAQSRADAAYNNAVNQINAAFGSANAGWWRIGHNGLIFQSGRVVLSGSQRVNFPFSFPNGPTCIIVTVGTSYNVNTTYNNDTDLPPAAAQSVLSATSALALSSR